MVVKQILYRGRTFINNNIVFNRYSSVARRRKEIIAELKEKGYPDFFLRERPVGLTSRVILAYKPNTRLADYAIRISANGTTNTKSIEWLNSVSNGVKERAIDIFKAKIKFNGDTLITKKKLVTRGGKVVEHDVKEKRYESGQSLREIVTNYITQLFHRDL